MKTYIIFEVLQFCQKLRKDLPLQESIERLSWELNLDTKETDII